MGGSGSEDSILVNIEDITPDVPDHSLAPLLSSISQASS